MCEQNSLVLGGAVQAEGVSFIFHLDAVVERIRQEPLPLSVLPPSEHSCKKGDHWFSYTGERKAKPS